MPSAAFSDPDQEQAQPAGQRVGPEALLPVVDRTQIERRLQIPSGLLYLEELLGAECHLLGGEGGLRGPEEEPAAQPLRHRG